MNIHNEKGNFLESLKEIKIKKNFVSELQKYLTEKKDEFHDQKEMHYSSFRKMKILYYSLGLTSAIFSTIVSFVTGVYTYDRFDILILSSLILSLMVSIINSILSFGNVLSKISRHRDAYNKYDELILEIDKFLLNGDDKVEGRIFIENLENKITLIKNYEELSCCF